MTLAQVVYQYSTDAGFASHLRSDPRAALKERGWSLSKEEIEHFFSHIARFPEIDIHDLALKAGGGWK